MTTHEQWAAARNVATVCTREHVAIGGICRNCGYPDADRRTTPEPTLSEIFDRLAANGVEIVVNGQSSQGGSS